MIKKYFKLINISFLVLASFLMGGKAQADFIGFSAGTKVFRSADGTRTVLIAPPWDAYLVDTSGQNAFTPVYLGTQMINVAFTGAGANLKIYLRTNNETIDVRDNQGDRKFNPILMLDTPLNSQTPVPEDITLPTAEKAAAGMVSHPMTAYLPAGEDKGIKGDGYAGIPWGTPFEKSNLTNVTKTAENFDADRIGLWNVNNQDLNYYLFGFIFGLPYYANPDQQGAIETDYSAFPKGFDTYADPNGNYYIFYQNRFAFALTKADYRWDYQRDLLDFIRYYARVEKIFHRGLKTWEGTEGTSTAGFMITHYVKTEADIYVAHIYSTDMGASTDNLYLLYGSQKIRKEIQAILRHGAAFHGWPKN